MSPSFILLSLWNFAPRNHSADTDSSNTAVMCPSRANPAARSRPECRDIRERISRDRGSKTRARTLRSVIREILREKETGRKSRAENACHALATTKSLRVGGGQSASRTSNGRDETRGAIGGGDTSSANRDAATRDTPPRHGPPSSARWSLVTHHMTRATVLSGRPYLTVAH